MNFMEFLVYINFIIRYKRYNRTTTNYIIELGNKTSIEDYMYCVVRFNFDHIFFINKQICK